jgi:DNA-binding response OmpR family regulator
VTKILIVEDDRATTGLLKTIFELEGFKAIVCADPERVVDVVRHDRPDLVLMDYHLVGTESLSILQQLKHDEELREIRILMTSGLDRSRECEEAGAEGFILKPFRPAKLLAEVRAVLEPQSP